MYQQTHKKCVLNNSILSLNHEQCPGALLYSRALFVVKGKWLFLVPSVLTHTVLTQLLLASPLGINSCTRAEHRVEVGIGTHGFMLNSSYYDYN